MLTDRPEEDLPQAVKDLREQFPLNGQLEVAHNLCPSRSERVLIRSMTKDLRKSGWTVNWDAELHLANHPHAELSITSSFDPKGRAYNLVAYSLVEDQQAEVEILHRAQCLLQGMGLPMICDGEFLRLGRDRDGQILAPARLIEIELGSRD